MKQYYFIEIESIPYWKDSEKLIFNSYKELKEYVKNDIKFLMHEYPLSAELKEKYQVKKVYNKISSMVLYEDKINKSMLIDYRDQSNNEYYKKIGKAFQVDYTDKNGDFEHYITYFCFRILKKDLWKYAKFKELNQ